MQQNDSHQKQPPSAEMDELELLNSIYSGAAPEATAPAAPAAPAPDTKTQAPQASAPLHLDDDLYMPPPEMPPAKAPETQLDQAPHQAEPAAPVMGGGFSMAPSDPEEAPSGNEDKSAYDSMDPRKPIPAERGMVLTGPYARMQQEKQSRANDSNDINPGMGLVPFGQPRPGDEPAQGQGQGGKSADPSRDLVVSGFRADYIDHDPNASNSKDVAIFKSGLAVRGTGSDIAIATGSGVASRPRIGERLVLKGLITEAQLQVALSEQKLSGKLLGESLIDLNFISEQTLANFLAEDAGFELLDPNLTIFDGQALAMLSEDESKQLKMLPIAFSGQNQLLVALTDPYDVIGMDRLKQRLPRNIEVMPLVTTRSYILEAIEAAYGYTNDVESILKNLESEVVDTDMSKVKDADAFKHPIVRLVNALLLNAVKMGVSDLHFEPEENFVRLRNRLDGVLYTAQVIHKKHWAAMAQRVKIMCEMNIADKFSPQDGRISMSASGKHVDFRVSVLPTVHGENIVMRVLDKSASILPLEALGFSPENMAKIEHSQNRPEGIIIVTGPTGSGKSTSLYSMLNAVNTVDINIQTLEDPVEYSVPMIRQTPIKEGFLDFADGIKALLRQDPDIIFIGEIRDQTTAEMALKAAMTGHQVYSTLHTNDSFGAIPRLLDLGMKPGMLSGAIIAIFAQRLARRLCKNCKVDYVPTPEECKMLRLPEGSPPPTIKGPAEGGCATCSGTGYKGRIALVEILTFDEDMDDVLARGANKAELKSTARAKGFKSIREDAILKVLEGTTSYEEVYRTVDLAKE